MQLTYVAQDPVPNQRICLRGENSTVIANDTLTFRSAGTDTEVTYTADFSFTGIARFVAPLLRPAFTRSATRPRRAWLWPWPGCEACPGQEISPVTPRSRAKVWPRGLGERRKTGLWAHQLVRRFGVGCVREG